MAESIFDSKLVDPDDKMMTYELGETKEYFNRICEVIEKECSFYRALHWIFSDCVHTWRQSR